MANRENHYEAAFEQFLRTRQVPYVAVDEAKRSLLAVSHEPFEEQRAHHKEVKARLGCIQVPALIRKPFPRHH